MFWLVENNTQLQYFIDVNKNKDIKEAYVEIIQGNDLYHPRISTPIIFYIRPVEYKKGFIFSLEHNDAGSVSPSLLKQLLDSFDTIYLRDKKSSLYHFKHKNIIDINFIEYKEKLNINTKVHTHFYQLYNHRNDVNKVIPIVKHYERCEEIYDNIKHIFKKDKPLSFNFYNDLTTHVFHFLEKSGLTINLDKFNKHYETNHSSYSIVDNKIFTHYNLYTTTRRPSNSFNGINFTALNKKDGSRKAFIPQNDLFIEIDITAYHPTLAAKLTGAPFNIDTLYQEIGKENVFKQLYGGIQKEYLDHPYFSQCQEYINETYSKFKNNNHILAPISEYALTDISKPNPFKLFNYLLQNYETSNNTLILKDIFTLLKGKKSKLVLYTYDAFLIDYSKKDTKQIIKDILNIFDKYNLKVKIKHGLNYDSLLPL